ncbi:MAG TPA: HNH endonuclease signature motif containing protein [Pseudolabrys sp.]
MAQRVNLDAMIRREDFAREIKDAPAPETIRELNLSQLLPNSAIRRQLRKPEFQRETNHWTPDQVLKFLSSFIDGDVIPSIILWRSTNFIFVIDGAHRLGALCAWISNDYGDGTESKSFYSDEISKEQIRIAGRTRRLVEKAIGKYESLDHMVGRPATDLAGRRAGAMNTRPIFLQTVVGNARVAEDSFFAINSQGTPLDETETYLIKNRYKPVAIGARAIVRAGFGHAYWSAFSQQNKTEIVKLAGELHKIIFEPEVTTPLKTLDLPLGGSKSPVDAMAVLIDFLIVSDAKGGTGDKFDPSVYINDESGEKTIEVLRGGLQIARRITGDLPASLGLHPAVYFSNDKGKHNRFLFLGMCALIVERLRANDDGWFRKFTQARQRVESFLLANKSVIGIVLQNLSKGTRIPKMREMFRYLVDEGAAKRSPEAAAVFEHLGLKGKIYDLTSSPRSVAFSDDTKSQIYYRQAINVARKCPICLGLLDVSKSVSYDHITPVREGGLGVAENGQMVHPYCNSLKG